MWSRFSRLLIGFVLLGLTGWFLTYVAHGWDHTWQREQAAVAKSKSVSLIDPTLANDPSIAPAKVKVIGPLASAMQHEQDDVNGTDNTAIAEPASSAQPTAFDHVERPSTTAPRRFHSTFLVKGYRYYQLLVPAHISSPKLQGRFAAFTSTPDKSAADAEFLVLDDGQFNDLVHRGGENAVFSTTSSVGIIDVTLSPAPFESKKYYLVFRSPDRHARVVSAHITASFE